MYPWLLYSLITLSSDPVLSNPVILSLIELHHIDKSGKIVIHNMDVLLKDCNTPQLYLTAGHNMSNESTLGSFSMTLSNSSIGQLNVSSGYKVSLLDSHFDGRDRPEIPLIILEDSSLFIENSTFMHNKEMTNSSLVTLHNAHYLRVNNSTFSHNILVSKLIDVNETTDIRFEFVTFWNNTVKPVNDTVMFFLKLKNVMDFTMERTTFLDNTIGFSVGSFLVAVVNVYNSTLMEIAFNGNMIEKNGSLLGIQNTNMQLENCDFSKNSVAHFLVLIDHVDRRTMHTTNMAHNVTCLVYTNVNIQQSKFMRNSAMVLLQVRSSSKALLNVTKFVSNSAIALAYFEKNGSVTMDGLLFLSNFVSAWMFYIKQSNLYIRQSNLVNNTSTKRGFLISTNASRLVADDITVSHNDGMFLVIGQDSNISLTSSIFRKNVFDTLITLTKSEIQIKYSLFKSNHMHIIYGIASTVHIKDTVLSGPEIIFQIFVELMSSLIMEKSQMVSIGQIGCKNSMCLFKDSLFKNNSNQDSVLRISEHATGFFYKVHFEGNNAATLVQVDDQANVEFKRCIFENNIAFPDILVENSMLVCKNSNIVFTNTQIEGYKIPELDLGVIGDTFAQCDACLMSLINTSFITHHTQSMFAIDSNIANSDISFYNCTLHFDSSEDHKSTTDWSGWPSPRKDAQFRYAMTRVDIQDPYNKCSIYGHLKNIKTYRSSFRFNRTEFHSRQLNTSWIVVKTYVNHSETPFTSGKYIYKNHLFTLVAQGGTVKFFSSQVS